MATEAKHTPGPWTALATDPAEGWNGFTVAAQPNPAMRGFTKVIAEVQGPQGDAERASNARLIAAAPDMYEALIMQRAYIKHWLEDVSANLKPTVASLDDALAAIYGALAKAEGRSNA